MEYIYTMEYYAAMRKEEILLAITWMDLEGIRLRESQILYEVAYVWNLKKSNM